jgi:cytochrome c-type biogenesis protein CcmH
VNVFFGRSSRAAMVGLGLAACLALLSAATAAAQPPTPSDNDVNHVASQLYCPVCENVPLDVCPTQACAQWRELIREKLAAGWSDEQIKQYFVTQYGDRVLAAPPARGLNWLVYVLPPVAILIGAGILAAVLRSWRSEATPEPDAAPSTDDPYIQQMEEELKRRERGD